MSDRESARRYCFWDKIYNPPITDLDMTFLNVEMVARRSNSIDLFDHVAAIHHSTQLL